MQQAGDKLLPEHITYIQDLRNIYRIPVTLNEINKYLRIYDLITLKIKDIVEIFLYPQGQRIKKNKKSIKISA